MASARKPELDIFGDLQRNRNEPYHALMFHSIPSSPFFFFFFVIITVQLLLYKQKQGPSWFSLHSIYNETQNGLAGSTGMLW